jgi:hypothetical protein
MLFPNPTFMLSAPTVKVFETNEELRAVLEGDPCPPESGGECERNFSKSFAS